MRHKFALFFTLLLALCFAAPQKTTATTSEEVPIWTYSTGTYSHAVAISSDGLYIAAGSDNGNLYLFHKDSSTPLWVFSAGANVSSVAISSNGFYITAGADNGYIYLFNRTSNQQMWNYTAGPSALNSVSMSADGQYLAASGPGGVSRLFVSPLFSPVVFDISSTRVRVSSDGQYVCSNGGSYFVFQNTTSPAPGGEWDIFSGGADLKEAALSSDGQYIIIAGGTSNTGYLYDKTGASLWNYTSGDSIRTADISSDGQYLVVGEESGNVTLFNRISSTPLWFKTTGNYILSARISSGRFGVFYGFQPGGLHALLADQPRYAIPVSL